MIFKPEDFGDLVQTPEAAPANTAIFNLMFDAIRANGGYGATHGAVELDGDYYIGEVNATNIHIVEIRSNPFTRIWGHCSTPAAIFDLSNSRSRIIGDMLVFGESNCKAALLISNSDLTIVDGLRTDRDFSSGAVCIVNGFSVNFRGGQIMNRNALAPAVNISVDPDWWITSLYAPWPPTMYQNCEDIYFYGTEIHGLGRQNWTVYMRGVRHVLFDGGICDNSGIAHMLFQGNCTHVTTNGHKYYSELGTPAQAVYHADQINNSCSKLKVINPYYDYIPLLTKGPGTFPGYNLY